MFMKKAFAAVLATAVLVAGAVEAKDLRVASNTTFPPFEFVNTKTQEITGFEMDLIRAMGKQAGYEVKITNMAFDGIIRSALRLRRRRRLRLLRHRGAQEARSLHGTVLQVRPDGARRQGQRGQDPGLQGS